MSEARVGVGVFIFKNGKFLVGHRGGSHASGTWALPGGHLEFGESFEQTARREIAEENGLEIENIRFGAVTNDVFSEENKHYITIWMISDWKSGEPKILESEKCLEWRWVDFDNLPEPRFPSWSRLFESQFLDEIKRQLKAS
jgi:8-oxo-dGTP diphosphatase